MTKLHRPARTSRRRRVARYVLLCLFLACLALYILARNSSWLYVSSRLPLVISLDRNVLTIIIAVAHAPASPPGELPDPIGFFAIGARSLAPGYYAFWISLFFPCALALLAFGATLIPTRRRSTGFPVANSQTPPPDTAPDRT